MKGVRNAVFGALLVGGALVPLWAQIKDGYVAWKPIRDARGYQVQVRRFGEEKILSDTVVSENYMKVDLAIGRYEIRTTPLNAFSRPTVWSEWNPLRVVISRPPDISTETRPLTATNLKSDPFRFAIDGDYFFSVMKVQLRRGERRLPLDVQEIREDGKRVYVVANLKGISPGSYDLILENPFDKKTELRDFLTVTDRKDPHDFARSEYDDYVEQLTRRCGGQQLPDILIKQCEEYFVILNLSDRDRANLYHYIQMTRGNYADRLAAYRYFSESCPPAFRPGRDFMQERLDSADRGVGPVERARLQEGLARLRGCG